MRVRQRELGRAGDSVIEGRDIGVVVAPDAEVKVWLVADPGVRARAPARSSATGSRSTSSPAELRRRDERDAVNTHRADDAVEIDTTDMTLAEVVGRIASLVEGARSSLPDVIVGARPADHRGARRGSPRASRCTGRIACRSTAGS